MRLVFLSRQSVNTRRPQVRQSDQSHQAAGSTGSSDHWTGSSVSVFPLDMTSVQLPAGKTTHTHTITSQTHDRGATVQNGMHANRQSIFNLNSHFGWFLLCSTAAQRAGGWLTGQSRRTPYITSHLLSVFVASYIFLNIPCPTSGSTQWWHSSSTCSKIFYFL